MKMIAVVTLLLAGSAFAKNAVNFKNEEITALIEMYSKASGQKFVVDSTVRGKIALLNQSEISNDEFFNQLSAGLAVNGFAIIKQGDIMIVRNARSAQRDFLETSTVVPSIHPTRMYTWIYNPKYMSAQVISKDIRMLSSSYGELASSPETNQLIVTDWTPNIVRIAEMLKQLDRPVSAATKKIIETQRKSNFANRKEVVIVKKGEGGEEVEKVIEEVKKEKN